MTPPVSRRLVLAASLGFGLAACAPEPQVTRTDTFRGMEVYAPNCAACHGADARGNPARPDAPDLTRIAARNGGTFPRDAVMSTIDGYTRSPKGAEMPAFGAGDLGPLVQVEMDGVSTPIPADLLALTTYLASLQK